VPITRKIVRKNRRGPRHRTASTYQPFGRTIHARVIKSISVVEVGILFLISVSGVKTYSAGRVESETNAELPSHPEQMPLILGMSPQNVVRSAFSNPGNNRGELLQPVLSRWVGVVC